MLKVKKERQGPETSSIERAVLLLYESAAENSVFGLVGVYECIVHSLLHDVREAWLTFSVPFPRLVPAL